MTQPSLEVTDALPIIKTLLEGSEVSYDKKSSKPLSAKRLKLANVGLLREAKVTFDSMDLRQITNLKVLDRNIVCQEATEQKTNPIALTLEGEAAGQLEVVEYMFDWSNFHVLEHVFNLKPDGLPMEDLIDSTGVYIDGDISEFAFGGTFGLREGMSEELAVTYIDECSVLFAAIQDTMAQFDNRGTNL